MHDLEQSSVKSTEVLRTGIVVLTVSLMVLSLLDWTSFWSLQSWRAVAWPIRFSVVLIIIVSSIPRISDQISGLLLNLIGHSHSARNSRFLALAMIVFLAGLALLHSENHLLGDGYNVMGNIRAGKYHSQTEPLSYILHAGLAGVFAGSADNVALAFRVTSLIAGLILFGFLFFWTRDRRHGMLFLAAFLSFAVLQFLAGYVENYTFSFLFSLLYLAQACRDLEQSRLRVITILFFVVAVAFHLSAAVLLPAVAYQLYRSTTGKWSRSLILLITASCGALGIVFITKSGFLSHAFVPLLPTSENAYSLFSSEHLLDLVNVLIRAYPLLPLMLLLPVAWTLPQRGFIGLALLFSLLFTVIVDPKLGAFRDWDLLSIASAPAIVLSLLAIERCAETNRKLAYQLFAPLVLFGLMHTGSWIYQNSFREESYEALKLEIRRDIHYSDRYLKGERLNSWAQLAGSSFRDASEVFRAQTMRLKADPNDNLTRYNLAMNYVLNGDTTTAADLLAENWHAVPDQPNVNYIVGSTLAAAHRYAALEALYESAPKEAPFGYRMYLDLAALKSMRGVMDTACLYYEYALALVPDPPLLDKVHIGMFWLRNGYESRGAALLSTAKDRLPADVVALLDQAAAARFPNQRQEFDSLMTLIRTRLPRS